MAPTELEPAEIARRLKAARTLGGFKSTAELAKVLPAGLGDKTLRKMESVNDPRMPRSHELAAIAEATGVQPDFFTVDRDALGYPPDLLEPTHFLRGASEEDLKAADMAAYEAQRALVRDFGAHAPGAAVMLQTVLDELDELRQSIRETRELEHKVDRLLRALGLEDEDRDPAIAFAEAIEAAVRAPRGSQPGHDAAAGANDS